MSEWRHPTMADQGITGEVRCRCSRIKQPAEMLEVRSLGVGTDYLCVPCVEDLYRKGLVDRLTMHQKAGAPPEWLVAYDTKLRAGPLLRSGLPQEIWGEILAAEYEAELPLHEQRATLWAAELVRREEEAARGAEPA